MRGGVLVAPASPSPPNGAHMSPIRRVRSVAHAEPTIEGAGVHLHRAFGFSDTEAFDPFLLLDDFRNTRPAHYQAGFPWHPHRGIETITYVLAGNVTHADSLGNRGTLGPGDVQWMTAGSGIIHEEMPQGDDRGRMEGFQLWANLPAQLKMTSPRYQEIRAAAVPEVTTDDGAQVRLICGEFAGQSGPIEGIAAEPRYLDVTLPPNQTARLSVAAGHTAFAYVFQGECRFQDGEAGPLADNRVLVLFDDGDAIAAETGTSGCRFLLISGQPLREPVAWRGPIVMNTRSQLLKAYADLEKGTFIR